MNRTFLITILILFSFGGFSQSIHSLKVRGISVDTIDFATLNDKKILIINTASAAADASLQISGLNELGRQYSDSGLVIIIFPSNDFNNEPKSVQELKALYTGSNFLVGDKLSVKGDSISAVYNWLTKKLNNGVMDASVVKDFQKFLINKNGKLTGVFSGKLNPSNDILKNAITNN